MSRFTLESHVFDALMPDLVGHDQRPSAFLVYLALSLRRAREESLRLSHRQLADLTGLSKSAVQDAVRHLVRRRLLGVQRTTPTATPEYTVLRPWLRR